MKQEQFQTWKRKPVKERKRGGKFQREISFHKSCYQSHPLYYTSTTLKPRHQSDGSVLQTDTPTQRSLYLRETSRPRSTSSDGRTDSSSSSAYRWCSRSCSHTDTSASLRETDTQTDRHADTQRNIQSEQNLFLYGSYRSDSRYLRHIWGYIPFWKKIFMSLIGHNRLHMTLFHFLGKIYNF